jgi:hypothetical protein
MIDEVQRQGRILLDPPFVVHVPCSIVTSQER